MQAGEPGERASRQLRSAPLCLCNGKNPLGTRRKISTYAPPAQQSWARPAVDGGTRARDGRGDGGEHSQSLGLLRSAPRRGKTGLCPAPPRPWGSEPLLRDAPQKAFALAIIRISRLCPLVGKAETAEGKCSNLARKNFLRWRLRPHCCDLWGLAQPRLHPHTHTHVSSPAFPALPPCNFWSGNIILVSGKSSSDC